MNHKERRNCIEYVIIKMLSAVSHLSQRLLNDSQKRRFK